MNTKLNINSSNMEYYYPYMGMFTNNPNDIRSLQFLNYHYNKQEKEYIKEIGNRKYLKYEYYKLFEDAFQHLHNIKSHYLNIEHHQNYYFRKWYFDFIYSGDDDDEFFKFPTLYPEKEIYQYVFPRKEIKDYLDDKNVDEDTISDFIEYGLDITDLDNENYDNWNKILEGLIEIYKERLEDYINNLDGYIDENNIVTPFNFNSIQSQFKTTFKTIFIGPFDKDKTKLIININELLDNKYVQFAMLKEDKEHDGRIEVEPQYNEEACMQTYLNIDKDKCNNILKNVLFKEKGYGEESKEFFRNDKNFKIFDKYHMENIQEISFIYRSILDKLNFKIKERKFYINDDIYDYFLAEKHCKSIKQVYKYTVEIESKEPVFKDFNENDKLMIYHNILKKNILSKITKKIDGYKVQITLNKTIINNFGVSNYEEKDEDYEVKEDEKENKKNDDIAFIGIDKIIIDKGNIYLKYYESVESWKKHQTIDPVLNNNNNLLEYLNLFINTINKRIIFLNPIFKNINESIKETGFIERFILYKNIQLNKDNLYLIPYNLKKKKK